MEHKIEVMQKIVDDVYVKGCYVWNIIDENGKIKMTGEGKSWEECLTEARKKIKRFN